MGSRKGIKNYPEAVKLEAVRLYLEEGKTRAQVAAILGVRDPKRIQNWLKEYRREGVAGLCKPQGRPRREAVSELERLRMEVALLKKFHTELREVQLAQRNIGCSTTCEASTK